MTRFELCKNRMQRIGSPTTTIRPLWNLELGLGLELRIDAVHDAQANRRQFGRVC